MDKELLLEAVYIFNVYCKTKKISNSRLFKIISDLPPNILKSTFRILVVNKLALYKKRNYYLTEKNLFNLKSLRNQINEENISDCIKNLIERIDYNKDNPFFKELSDSEYEIYARCNFPVALTMGEALSGICDFNNTSILDIGGNSGGLGTAILKCYPTSDVTVIDKTIPCAIGNEYKNTYKTENLIFMEDDFFHLNLNKDYDYIILSNILHDYNDKDCQRILEICERHFHKNTKILVLEDILDGEHEPVKVLEHGLRLSVNTLCGQQRTVDELKTLMKVVNMYPIKKDSINEIQSVIVYEIKK